MPWSQLFQNNNDNQTRLLFKNSYALVFVFGIPFERMSISTGNSHNEWYEITFFSITRDSFCGLNPILLMLVGLCELPGEINPIDLIFETDYIIYDGGVFLQKDM